MVPSVAGGFGAKGLAAFWLERLAKGFAGEGPPVAVFCANKEPPLGFASGEVCMLSSAGEVICEADWPNRPELAGVLVVFCVPNPLPKDGAGVEVEFDWSPMPPALNPPKLG